MLTNRKTTRNRDLVSLMFCLLLVSLPLRCGAQDSEEVRSTPPAKLVQIRGFDDSIIALDREAKVIYRIQNISRLKRLDSLGIPGHIVEPEKSSKGQAKLIASKKTEIIWAGAPLKDPAGIAVDEHGVIYVADPGSASIFAFLEPGSITQVFSGIPLVTPTGIAVARNKIFVSDRGSQAIFSLSTNALDMPTIEYRPPLASFPETLVWDSENLFALNRRSKVLYRFFTAGTENFPTEQTSLDLAMKGKTLNEGQLILLPESELSDPGDFTVFRNVVYLLDASQQKLILLPLLSGEPISLKLSLFGIRADLITAEGNALHLVDTEVNSIRNSPTLLPVTLYFEAGTPSENLVDFYEYLLRRHLLPTKNYTLREGEVISNVVISQNVLPDGYVQSFDKLFCKLNAKVCAQRATPLVLRAGETVQLPNLKVTSYTAQRIVALPLDIKGKGYEDPRLTKHASGSLGDLAGEFFQRDRDKLRKTLGQYNYWYEGNDILSEKRGTFSIPVDAVRVEAAIPRSDFVETNSELSLLVKEMKNVKVVPHGEIQSAMGVKSVGNWRLLEPAQSPSTLPPNDSRCEQVAAQKWTRVFELVDYCLPKDVSPSYVGLIDYFFDASHPKFQGAGSESRLKVFVRPGVPERLPIPGSGHDAFDWKIDHGTHLAGIIGADNSSDHVTGIEPHAVMYGASPNDFRDLAASLPSLHTFVLSLGERDDSECHLPSSSTSLLREEIEKRPWTLFVVASGNDGQSVVEDCLAGLGDRNNVLVVASADQKSPPSLSNFSNRGYEKVHLAAPGEDVESTLFGGGFGNGTGTSQATALVGATAAILQTLQPTWKPWRIKDRLISTAQLWTDTKDAGHVFSGMLDVRVAVLDLDKTVVRFMDGSECKGQIALPDQDKEIIIRPSDGGDEKHIAYKNLRRFWRSADKHTFTAIYSVEEGQPGALERPRSLHRQNKLSLNEVINSGGAGAFRLVTNDEGCRPSTLVDILQVKDIVNHFYQ